VRGGEGGREGGREGGVVLYVVHVYCHKKEMGEEDKEDEGEERIVLNKRHEGRRRRKEGMEERKDTPVCGCDWMSTFEKQGQEKKEGRAGKPQTKGNEEGKERHKRKVFGGGGARK